MFGQPQSQVDVKLLKCCLLLIVFHQSPKTFFHLSFIGSFTHRFTPLVSTPKQNKIFFDLFLVRVVFSCQLIYVSPLSVAVSPLSLQPSPQRVNDDDDDWRDIGRSFSTRKFAYY